MRVRTRKRKWRKVGECLCESRIGYNPKWTLGPWTPWHRKLTRLPKGPREKGPFVAD